MPINFNPHLQAAVLEVVENQLVEQQAIVVFINKKNTEFHALCAQIEAQSATLTAYRKSQINELVTGQFRRSGRAERNPTQLKNNLGNVDTHVVLRLINPWWI